MAEYSMAEYKLTPTERDIVYLGKYLFEIWGDLTDLQTELEINKSLKNFPKYRKLVEVTKLFGKYVDELIKYSKDPRSLVASKHWLENILDFLGEHVYPVALEVDKYRTTEFRKHWKDEITDELEESKDIVSNIKKSEEILRRLYKMRDVEPELIKKYEKMKKIGKPEKTLILIAFILSLGFGTLKLLSSTQPAAIGVIGTTGFFISPTAKIVGINFEMLYIITSSMILGIYILGKLMKKW